MSPAARVDVRHRSDDPAKAVHRAARGLETVSLCSFEAALARSRRTSGIECQQLSLGNDDVGQPEQAVQLRLVLGQALVANLPVLEQVLDHMELMLDLGTNAGIELFSALLTS